MNSKKKFQDKSYKQHSDHFEEYASGKEKSEKAKTWLDDSTVDFWRHERMYKTLDPIIESDIKAKWLTVGDGRFGKDAKYILDKGGDALASDLTDVLLKEAKASGYINDYKKENAESLSFKDAEFDYVFCKESYHHFPRPMIALYEMLRVATKGVVLIEPNDVYITKSPLSGLFTRFLKDCAKFVLRKKISRHSFEESGNYIFTISRRELEKVAVGLDYEVIAFKGINDVHLPGVEYEKKSENGRLQRKIKIMLGLANFLCKLGLMDYMLMTVVTFKEKPSDKLLKQLDIDGYEVVSLPKNPYII